MLPLRIRLRKNHCNLFPGHRIALAVLSACFCPIQSSSGADALMRLGTPAQGASTAQPATDAPRPLRPAADRAPAPIRYNHGEPSDLEQYMLELLNDSRAHPAETAAELGIGLNDGIAAGQTIIAAPKPPLAFNPNLIAAARAHSLWMLDTDTFSHDGENGLHPDERMSEANYLFTPPYKWGENIAQSGSTQAVDPVQYVLDEHHGLFKSPGHRVNMMEPGFEEIGIAVEQGKFYTQGRNFNAVIATQDFATSDGTPGPFITGVVFADRDNDGFYSPGEGIAGVEVRPNKGSHYAVTSKSGGYAIPFQRYAGPLTLTFKLPDFPVEIKRHVNGKTTNVGGRLNLSEISPQFAADTIRIDSNGHFSCKIAGPYGRDVRVEWSEDLVHWKPKTTLHLPGGTASFADSSSGRQQRFYRLKVVD